MLQRIHRFFDVPLTLLRLLYLRVDFDLKDLNAGQSIEEDVFQSLSRGYTPNSPSQSMLSRSQLSSR